MKSHKNNDKASVEEQSALLFNELVEAVVEDAQDRKTSEVEAFGSYVQSVRSKMHLDLETFKKRFSKGYEVLLQQIKNES